MEPTNCINIPPNALQPCHTFALLRLTFSGVYDASLIFPVLLSFTPGSTRSYQPSNTKPNKIYQNHEKYVAWSQVHHHTVPPRAATCENVDCSFSTWIGKTQGPRHMKAALLLIGPSGFISDYLYGWPSLAGWTSTWSIQKSDPYPCVSWPFSSSISQVIKRNDDSSDR